MIDPLGRYHYAKGLRQDCTPPAGFADRVVPSHDQYWQTEEAMAEGAPARALARGEKTELPPVLYLSRTHETGHPRPDLDEFVTQYRQAGGHVDLSMFDGEGDGFLTKNLASPGANRPLSSSSRSSITTSPDGDILGRNRQGAPCTV